jgi:hypothetical protein
MEALILGLLVASAQGSYNTQGAELTQLAANVTLLDRVSAHYGPATKEIRDLSFATPLLVGFRRNLLDTGNVHTFLGSYFAL